MISLIHFLTATVLFVLVCLYRRFKGNYIDSKSKVIVAFTIFIGLNFFLTQPYYIDKYEDVFDASYIKIEFNDGDHELKVDCADLFQQRATRGFLYTRRNILELLNVFDDEKYLLLEFFDDTDSIVGTLSIAKVDYENDLTTKINDTTIIGKNGIYNIRFNEPFYSILESYLNNEQIPNN